MPVKRSIREFAVTSTFPIRNCILQVFNYGKHLSSIFKHKNSNSYKIFYFSMAGYHGVTTKHTPQILVRVIPDVTTKELEDLGCLDGRWGICVKM